MSLAPLQGQLKALRESNERNFKELRESNERNFADVKSGLSEVKAEVSGVTAELRGIKEVLERAFPAPKKDRPHSPGNGAAIPLEDDAE